VLCFDRLDSFYYVEKSCLKLLCLPVIAVSAQSRLMALAFALTQRALVERCPPFYRVPRYFFVGS